jgi:hypothetical protein
MGMVGQPLHRFRRPFRLLRYVRSLFKLCPARQDRDLQIIAVRYLRAAWLLTANYLDNVAAPPCFSRSKPADLLQPTLREIETRAAIRNIGCLQFSQRQDPNVSGMINENAINRDLTTCIEALCRSRNKPIYVYRISRSGARSPTRTRCDRCRHDCPALRNNSE